MKTEKRTMQTQNQNTILKELATKNLELDDGTQISQYSAILALLDLCYFDKTSSDVDRQALLQAAQIPDYTYNLTDYDIEAVQQAALWYFNNFGENEIYDQYNASRWLNYTLNGTTYTSLSGYNLEEREGEQRHLQAEMLYNYLVRTAIENAPKYDNIETQAGLPAQVNTTSLNYEESNGNYIIGPINITENENIVKLYTIRCV